MAAEGGGTNLMRRFKVARRTKRHRHRDEGR